MAQVKESRYAGAYWAERSDLLYYKYVDYIIRCIAKDAKSIIDVGTGNCPYLEWWSWIPRKMSVDIRAPYSSAAVEGVTANILSHDFNEEFDICTCLQVLEHVENPFAFANKLLVLGRTVIVSVPYEWPEGRTKGHLHDPVTAEKLASWIGRRPNYSIIVTEPFRTVKHQRLVAIYDRDLNRHWARDIDQRIVRQIGPL